MLLLAFSCPLAAQATTRVTPDSVAPDSVPADTIRTDSIAADSLSPAATVPDSLTARPIRPLGAFWRSLLVPGWGQLKVGRKVTAGLFVVTEGLTLGMSLKANQDLGYLRRIGADSAAIAAKVRTREDWYVLLAVNHLLAGLEAFIAAHLVDFPAELRVERAPGRVDAGFAVPLRLR
ncbi:MAG: hypothetical protein ACREOC_07115 [Gemmatimonadales bacterium]